jgi:uncharacterized membrane-anchored protein YjiN (DUF445 family)
MYEQGSWLFSKNDEIVMNKMKMEDILLDIIRYDIINYNEEYHVPYFRKRLINDPITEKLKNTALIILDELSQNLEDLVNKEEPEDQKIRRSKLQELVSLCEEIKDGWSWKKTEPGMVEDIINHLTKFISEKGIKEFSIEEIKFLQKSDRTFPYPICIGISVNNKDINIIDDHIDNFIDQFHPNYDIHIRQKLDNVDNVDNVNKKFTFRCTLS